MSFTDDYLAHKKKKKKEEEKDIAPLYTNKTAAFFDPNPLKNIAPVATTKATETDEDEERTWFKKGAFDDGYQFGDVTKTILGTMGDTFENIGAGIAGMGEKALDALTMMAASNADMQMRMTATDAVAYNAITGKDTEGVREEYEEMAKDIKGQAAGFVAKDLYDEEKVAKAIISDPLKKVTGFDVELNSVLGEKSDALVQSAGQLAGQYGLQLVGVPWFVTSFATSYGSEAENALQQGATFEEAGLSATISAGAEVLSEKLFGGDLFTNGAGMDIATKHLATAISNKTIRALVKLGIDAAGEGFEEVVSQTLSNLGSALYKEENVGEILFNEEALDGYVESFIGGAVLGGGMGSINAVSSNKKGVDYVTGLNESEQAVVDKVFKDKLAEAEKTGKVSAKQKSKIFEETVSEMEKGYISTDVIEEVLGDRTAYDSLAKEAEEYNSLYNTATGQLSKAQQDRLAELEAKNKENPYKDALENAKNQHSQSVFELVKGDRLVESYNEKSRRSQKFEADLSQYDSKYHKTIQNAINSGTLNNTRRTHELVDFIAKISADKGVPFDFTNNEKISGTSFAVEGKIVNGYKTADGIAINIDSPKYLNSTVGHEITHVLEGTKLYDTLRETIFNYAISKEGQVGFDARLKAVEKMYNGIEGTTAEAELTADLVGEYLFTDKDFIYRLSTENRNIFQKMFDEVKYLCKVATAGSKEARELEKVKKAFEDAYRGETKRNVKSKFNVSEVVEETKDLIATHNITPQLLVEALDRGSLVMPSLAVTNNEFSYFGDISLLFDKQTIDPEADPNNKMYGADAWTPTQTALKKNAKFDSQATESTIAGIREKLGAHANELFPASAEQFSNTIREADGSIYDAYAHNIGMQTAYALEKGFITEIPTNKNGIVDTMALEEQLGAELDTDNGWRQYKRWLNDISDTVIESYDTATNEDILNNMKAQPASAKTFKLSADGSLVVPASEYSSIDEVRSNKNRLSENASNDTKTVGNEFLDLAKNIDGDTKSVVDAINAAFANRYSVADIIKTFHQQGINISNDIANELQALYKKAVELPTEYFEAKPHREVGFNEVAAFVVPNNIDASLKQRLLDDGYNVVEYDPNVEGDRKRVVNSFDSIKFSLGYHAGDLGKSEGYHMQGGYRGTGHFGTGTYFVGNKAAIEGYNSRNGKPAPVETVEFDNYNLYKVHTDKIGYELHDSLHSLDAGFTQEFLDAAKAGEMRVSKLRQDAWDRAERYDTLEWDEELEMDLHKDFIGASIRAYTEVAQENNLDVQSYDEWLESQGGEPISPDDSDYEFYKSDYLDYLKKKIEAVDKEKNSSYDDFNSAYFNLCLRFGKDNVNSALQKVLEHDAAMENGGYAAQVGADSRATVFMKSLGYEGIDVRGTGLDNTKYGSVIYDLKGDDLARKKEIGTAKYSLSDSDGNQLTKEQGEYFKDSKVRDENGNLKVVYHGSPADFNTFSLDYLGTNGTAEGYGFYFTDKRSIAERYSKGREGQQNGESGKLFEVYLDIKKPLSDKKVTMTRQQFKKFLTTLNNQVDADGERLDVLSNYGDVEWEGLNKVLNYAMEIEYDGSDSDVNLIHSIINGCGDMKTVFRVLRETTGYDGIIVDEATWGGEQTIYLAFHPEQIKNVDNLNPTEDPDVRRSLSTEGDKPRVNGGYRVSGKDVAYAPVKEAQKEIAPVVEVKPEQTAPETPEATETPETTVQTEEEMFPDDLAPVQSELSRLIAERTDISDRLLELGQKEEFGDEFHQLSAQWDAVNKRAQALEKELNDSDAGRLESFTDADAPPEVEYSRDPREPSETTEYQDPFADRDWFSVGKDRKLNAFMTDHPEVKPFFRDDALAMLGDLNDSQKGERWFNGDLYYASGGEKGWGGQSRFTSEDIEELLDSWHMTWAQIEEGLNAIAYDSDKVNRAAAKKLEFMLHQRLTKGYMDFHTKRRVPPNQAYIDTLKQMQANAEASAQARESFESLMENADQYAPVERPIAPVVEKAPAATAPVAPAATKPTETVLPGGKEVDGQQTYVTTEDKLNSRRQQTGTGATAPTYDVRGGDAILGQQTMFQGAPPNGNGGQTAQVLTEEPATGKKKSNAWSKFKNLVLDKGMVFEDLALKTGNRELQARWNSIRYAEGKAQKLIGEGNSAVKSLKSIEEKVEKSGKTEQFYWYLYHLHNVDRMTLELRFRDTPNKAVFGDNVTADMSRNAAARLVKANPEFAGWAKEVYSFNKYLRKMLVDGNVISQETADLWETMYPHYVPIRRAGHSGLNISVPLDSNRTGVNAPIKRATGGNSDILPLFDTMAQRTIQTYRAIAKNRFGVELKNTLGTTIANESVGVDEAIDSIDTQDGLLQEGTNGRSPTFTVFENGERVMFEITDEMYYALKPTNEVFSGTNKVLNTISNIRRGTLTEYNPWFMLKNAVKDVQDVLINSQHAVRTYAAMPKAIKQMATKGHWYQEYMNNGGDQNTYFDNETNTFKAENKALETAKTVLGLNAISKANNIIEMLPRLSEYIASREAGESVDVAMLDAARVTTNFAAGGEATRWLNRNGATFLNASVQGAVQQARNIREAKANGLKGWASLAGKYIAAGLPAVLLNGLIWDDDEEYKELSEYVKENYYIVGKYGDGKFVRIPKGRTVAVIQNAFEQMTNLVTGDDEVDLGRFLDLVVTNLAPNNPLDNNIISPIVQVANNETWYGEDLVPQRLQDLPNGEQYDESTDAISRWLGETFNISPYKANYLIDQYSGVVGDTFLPMLTPEAESGDNSLGGNLIAPLKDMFTTDSVMNNQNVSDFYSTMDELTTNAKSSKATDEDILKYKYFNSVNTELSDLYKKKREIQNSNRSDETKYAQVRNIQKQIDDLAKEGLDAYADVDIDGSYATVGDRHYRWYVPAEGSKSEPGWEKITDDQLAKQQEVTKGLGISPGEYWGNKAEYDMKYYYPDKYSVLQEQGISVEDYKKNYEDSAFIYTDDYSWAADNPGKYAISKAVADDLEGYMGYKDEISEITKNNDSSSGVKDKDLVSDYINNLDIDYGQKIILYRSMYDSKADKEAYNYEIIEYLNSRDDISYEEMVAILEELDMVVDEDGNITW